MFEDPKVVNDAFYSRYGLGEGMSRAERLNKRNDIAKELISGTLLDRAEGLEKRAKEHHEREVREWSLDLDTIEEAKDIHECVSTSFSSIRHL